MKFLALWNKVYKIFSISRVNLDWGFLIPTDPALHTIYVWFDAPLAMSLRYLILMMNPL
jgi:methionyl-tRNA synthetase